MTTPAKPLFTAQKVGALTLPNRIVMAPMTRSRAGEGNVPTPLTALYYSQRATAGLIVSEATQVSPRGQGYVATPGIHTDAQVDAWRRVTDAVHAAGGRIALQLWHVGRVSHVAFQPNGDAPVAPSAIAIDGTTYTPTGPQPFSTPRALETSEIAGIVAEYRDGARRAKEAGFDLVEVHGANGYLPDQFLRDGSNTRTDGYGGSVENRARFLLEVTDAVVSVWGADRVGVRVSPTGNFNGMSDSDPEATFGYVARALGARKLAYLHVVEPVSDDATTRITPLLRDAFGGVLIANGGYSAERAAEALLRGEADLVSFGVPFLANPDLPARLAAGAPLNSPDRATFYGGGPKGYVDYPSLGAAAQAPAQAASASAQ